MPGPAISADLVLFGGQFADAVRGSRQWADPPEPWNLRFIKDTELAWLDGRPYIGDA